MLSLVLEYKGKIILKSPVQDELEYFRLLNTLEKQFIGVATCWLESNGFKYLKRQLNKPPQRIFNGIDGSWYSFDDFKLQHHKFPLRTCLLFANYCHSKELYYTYGF